MKNETLCRLGAWMMTFSLLLMISWSRGQDTAAQKKAEPKAPDPYEWTTESYSFPCFELLQGFTSKDRGELRHPKIPAANAPAEEILNYVKKSNSITSHFLDLQGMSLPEGVVVLFEPDSLTLTARAPRLIQGSIAFLAENYQASAEKYLVLEAHILEAPVTAVRSALEKSLQSPDHSALKIELENAPGSKRIFFGKTECRSGNRCQIQDADEIVYPANLELGAENATNYSSESEVWGTFFEFDPILGADDFTIDLNYMVKRDYAEPSFVHQTVARPNGRDVLMPKMKRTYAKTTSQITVHSGDAILLGAWAAGVGQEDAAKANSMLTAFVEVNAVKNLPVLNDRLLGMLTQHGDTIVKVPEGKLKFKQVAEEVPEGMIVRRYLIPPTFLMSGGSGGSGVAVDPFAEDPIASEPRFTVRVTAKDILKNAGIAFPEGSSANYLRSSSTLVVRNTPENIELVEAYIDSIRTSVEKMVGVIAYVVEAPSATIRRLAGETRLLANHEKQWGDLQQAEGVSILDTMWILGRSGNRSLTQWGHEFNYPVSLSVFEDSDEKAKDDRPNDQAENDGAAEQAKIGGLSAELDSRFIGSTFEVDPILGADNWTVDLNFAADRHHGAPITDLKFGGIGPNQEIRMDGPITKFRDSKIATQCVFRKGAIRMVSLWEPENEAGDENDLMRAVFLRVNVVELDEEADN